MLPVSFWRRFAAIDNVVAVKIAPFNRYRTLDVVRGVVEAGAADRVTLYTGNDDHIVLDLAHAVHGGGERPRDDGAHQGRAARPLERVGEDGGRIARPHSRRDRRRQTSGGSAGARLPGHRLQRGDLRRRQRFPRRHRRLPRNPAPAGAARGHLVPRSRTRRSGPARRKRSIASAPPIRTSTTTHSCAPTWSDGCREWAVGCRCAVIAVNWLACHRLAYDDHVGIDVRRSRRGRKSASAAALYAGDPEPPRAGGRVVSVRQARRGAEIRHALALGDRCMRCWSRTIAGSKTSR